MIWRILHFIFKFDYIYYEHQTIRGTVTGIARVRKMPSGKPSIRYIYRTVFNGTGIDSKFKKLCFIEDLPDDFKIIWLTCKREKYFPMSEEEWSSKLEEVLEGIK